MEKKKRNTNTVPGVRRRVYVLGFLSQLVALVQIVGHLVMLSLVVNPDHFDSQVASLNVGMSMLTGVYVGLTGRLLFLFHEKRYEETRGPEWMWWFCTLGIVTFNGLQLVWFSLTEDIIPAVVCSVASLIYLIFFKFAKDDLKFLRDDAAVAATTPIITTTASAMAAPSTRVSEDS
ncbi:uncharacterized protein LOC123519551 isoform X1 [Portunus trituberculatus]|uniref:uncharacterized protein LOC123519551 isoform X1 n=2 Tax=Portunus trituberculatus TaxID=210409 RepID=UPI001E1CC9A8|nr:uncharacterized protein LOC123519551 isoform X1 [Portunus trituberculatus]